MKTDQRNTAIVILLVAALAACGAQTTFLSPELRTQTRRVAVLTFKSSGFLGSQKFGSFCSDELANELVLQRRAIVVDRSVTNATAAALEIASGSFITAYQLKKLASSLGADVVILGEIRNVGQNLFNFEHKFYHLLITIRLVEPQSGDVIGLASNEIVGEEDPVQLIKALTHTIVSSLGRLKV